MLYVAVVGGSSCTDEESKQAYEIGAGVSRKGGVIICGGGSGVMEAAAAGVSAAGGTAIGILPGESTRQGNPYLAFAVATGMGEARNAIIARTADVVIAVGGEYGTLSEIALALKMKKPVIGLNSWVLKPPGNLRRAIVAVATSEEAVEKAFLLGGIG